jgi:hypothetical protein
MPDIQYVSSMIDPSKVAVLATAILLTCVTGAAAVEQEQETQPCTYAVIEPAEKIEFVAAPEVIRWLEAQNRIRQFQSLIQQWREERGGRSLHSQIAILPSYQHILGMGPDAIPLILTELKSEGNSPDHVWFLALAAITRDNPVPPNSRGKLLEMAKAWLEWGKIKGYVQMV